MRRVILINDDWLFHEGDLEVEQPAGKSLMYLQAKTERRRIGPASRFFPDAVRSYDPFGPLPSVEWQSVTLPHDYIIGKTPEKQYNEALGFFPYPNAWYRKHFRLHDLKENARVRLFFEGVSIHCRVYINGCPVAANECAYTPFEADVTDFVDFDGDNVLAVYIDNSEHEGWWYEGAGIYRDVYLEVSDPVSLSRDGVYVHPEKQKDGSWLLKVDTEVRNDGFDACTATVRSLAVSPEGTRIALEDVSAEVPARGSAVLKQQCAVADPALWDIALPNLYRMETELLADGIPADKAENRFGFRTIRFDADEGFFLNGRHVRIDGVCCHQDYGLTGKAVPRVAQRYRLELLKEMGANAYRCAHYPHHSYTMDCLDELGFLVMDETRWFDTSEKGMKQLEALIRRDRNHPSVILWSIGNEEPCHLTEAGVRIARGMMHLVRALDPTRPITTAVCHDPVNAPVLGIVDVIGINYNMGAFDDIRRKYPGKPIISTECCATGTTRGWYEEDDPAQGFVCAYDHDVNNTFKARETYHRFFWDRPWIAGSFQWAGIEHRGEAAWPRLCSASGALDLFLQRKDAFWQNQAHWLERPIIHILPHWNHNGLEGETRRVRVYTNCVSASLYLNGKCLGERANQPGVYMEWQVPYEPGVLEAVGAGASGETVRDTVRTTGAPFCLRLRMDRMLDHMAILTCDALDSNGSPVPDASPHVVFSGGPGVRILGTGSSHADHHPVTETDRSMHCGLISVLIQLEEGRGEWKLYAHSPGLQAAVITIGGQ